MLNFFSPIETPIVNNQYRLHNVTRCNNVIFTYLPSRLLNLSFIPLKPAAGWAAVRSTSAELTETHAPCIARLLFDFMGGEEAHVHPHRRVYLHPIHALLAWLRPEP